MSVSPSNTEEENIDERRQPTLRLRVKEKPQGILRLDINAAKPRRNSVEFRTPTEVEFPSPQTSSIDHLSVTFAPEERSMCSDTSVKVINIPSPTSPKLMSTTIKSMNNSDRLPAPDPDSSEDDDYSASVNAVIMRRASTRKSRRRSVRRRTSSPFSPDVESLYSGRRQSVYTNSSGETVISVDETTGSEEMYELLKLHKEVLSAVRTQPWPMRRKLRLVQLAHAYVKQHEGALHQRLAASHNTRDVVKRYRLLANKKLQYIKREIVNLSKYLTPWEMRIKQIESQFGSVVASYFTFLRWLLWVNLVIAITLISFVTIPEVLTADWKNSGDRKVMLEDERKRSADLVTLVNFEGILKYSPLFYGYYSNRNGTGGYRLPLAYFVTGLVVYVYSFIATLRKMAANSRLSKMSEKDDECIFTWKIFTGWDYMIGNPETAQNRVSSLVLGFKEALLEEAEKKREERNWKIIVSRIFVNFTVLILLAISAFVVIWVVQRSSEAGAETSWWRKNEINICLTLISSIFPIFFEILGLLEFYHPRKQLRVQLFRIMLLNLLNLYSLIIALFDKIGDMTKELQELINIPSTINSIFNLTATLQNVTVNSISNLTATVQNTTISFVSTLSDQLTSPLTTIANNINAGIPLETSTIIPKTCREILVNCSDITQNMTTVLTALLISTTVTTPMSYYKPDVTFNSTINQTDFNWINETSTQPNEKNITDLSLMFATNDSRNDFIDVYSQQNFYNNELLDSDFEQSLYSEMLNDESEQNRSTSENDVEILQINSTKNVTLTTASTFADNNIDNTSTKLCVIKVCDNDSIEEDNMISASKLIQDRTMEHSFTTRSTNEQKYSLHIRKKMRNLCWETSFGQELVKLTVTDLVFTIVSTLLVDFFRALFVRYMNNCWCWDLEKRFPQYGDFKIAENILHLVNNQGMVWMGMFFSPGIVAINLIKLIIMMYLRSWTVLTCNVPHEIVFRASRSNNFYFALLLTMLFLCVLPVGYAIVWVKPSHHCGPFSGYATISKMFTDFLHEILPEKFHQVLDYIASPGIVIPLLVLLILIIYYLLSLTDALREANLDLKEQLRKERTEERRKMFQIADKRYKSKSSFDNTPYGKWKKLFSTMAVTKQNSQDACPQVPGFDSNEKHAGENVDVKTENKKREIMAKIMKNAFGMQSMQTEDDGTDTELHDSLPEDGKIKHENVMQPSRKIKEKSNKAQITQDQRSDKKQQIKQQRQSSDGSVWSDNIPVITISKTLSSESILDDKKHVNIPHKEVKKAETYVTTIQTVNDKSKSSESNVDQKQSKESENKNLLRKLFKSTPKLLKFQTKQESIDDQKNSDEEIGKVIDNLSLSSKETKSNSPSMQISFESPKTNEAKRHKKPLSEYQQDKVLPENDDLVSNVTKTESSSDYKE